MSCRVNKQRIWGHRIMLEAKQHKLSSFVTLTYSDEKLPEGGSLVPKDATDFIKRLRFNLGGGLRYFLCGEYGDSTLRPHYHIALFGLACFGGQSTYNSRGGLRCCPACHKISDTWARGNIHVGSLEQESADYIAQYVTKKLTKADDPRLRPGCLPEFARMSLKPGIGFYAMDDVASELLRYDLHQRMADVPSTLRHGPRERPLGRYLTRRLRALVGRNEAAPQSVYDKVAEEMLPLRLAAKTSTEAPSLKDQIKLAAEPKNLRRERLRKIYRKARPL